MTEKRAMTTKQPSAEPSTEPGEPMTDDETPATDEEMEEFFDLLRSFRCESQEVEGERKVRCANCFGPWAPLDDECEDHAEVEHDADCPTITGPRIKARIEQDRATITTLRATVERLEKREADLVRQNALLFTPFDMDIKDRENTELRATIERLETERAYERKVSAHVLRDTIDQYKATIRSLRSEHWTNKEKP